MGCKAIRLISDRKDDAAIGIGTMIIFIAMILIAGIAASVLIQTMDQLQSQAMRTGQDVIGDVSTGIRINQISGKVDSSKISNLAIMISPILSMSHVDLSSVIISLSDTNTEVFLSYNPNCYAPSADLGLFNSINTSMLQSNEFGLIVIRDTDASCTQYTPTINEEDIIVIMVNTTSCFSGIAGRTEVYGRITPEQGISAVISFTVPSVLLSVIIDL
ncbi:MAG: archaellin/type IV pilin N-terminal domain-containing protein [Thermoplasmatota archaeon]